MEVAVDLLRLLQADLGTGGDVRGGAVRDHSRRAPHLQLFGVQRTTPGQKGKLASGQEAASVRRAMGTPRAAGSHLSGFLRAVSTTD